MDKIACECYKILGFICVIKIHVKKRLFLFLCYSYCCYYLSTLFSIRLSLSDYFRGLNNKNWSTNEKIASLFSRRTNSNLLIPSTGLNNLPTFSRCIQDYSLRPRLRNSRSELKHAGFLFRIFAIKAKFICQLLLSFSAASFERENNFIQLFICIPKIKNQRLVNLNFFFELVEEKNFFDEVNENCFLFSDDVYSVIIEILKRNLP